MKRYTDDETMQAIKEVCTDYIEKSLGTDNDISFSIRVHNLCEDYMNLKKEFIKLKNEYDELYYGILKVMGVDTDD